MSASVVRLSDVRARRARLAPPGPPPKPVEPAHHLTARPGVVVLELANGDELDLSPEHARVWAERLTAMADTAEALEREGGRG